MRIYRESYIIRSINDFRIIEGIIIDPTFYKYIQKLYSFKTSKPFQEGIDCRQVSTDICQAINMCTRSSSLARPLSTSYKKVSDKGITISDSPCESLMFDFNNRVYVLEDDGDIHGYYNVDKDTDNYAKITENILVPSDCAYNIRDFILSKAKRKFAPNLC